MCIRDRYTATALYEIKKPLHSSDLVRLIEPCGPLHDGEPKLYDRCLCSCAYGIRVRVHDGVSLVGMYASCVFTSIRDFLPAKTLQFDFNHNMNQLRKQGNSSVFMSKNVFSKCNTNIVPFIIVKDNS